MTEPTTDRPAPTVAGIVVDAFYTAVGLGVLAVNKVQVVRRERDEHGAGSGSDTLDPVARLEELVDSARRVAADPRTVPLAVQRVATELQALDELAQDVGRRMSEIVDRLEPDLPEPVRDLLLLTRDAVRDLSGQYRAVLGLQGGTG